MTVKCSFVSHVILAFLSSFHFAMLTRFSVLVYFHLGTPTVPSAQFPKVTAMQRRCKHKSVSVPDG